MSWGSGQGAGALPPRRLCRSGCSGNLLALGCGAGTPRVWAVAAVDGIEGGESGGSISLRWFRHRLDQRPHPPLPPGALEGALQPVPWKVGTWNQVQTVLPSVPRGPFLLACLRAA